MKAIFLNASPRKTANTAQLLKAAQQGAKASSYETEYYNLYDLNFAGCRSCFACKRKGIEHPCQCYWKDDLSPILEHIYKADRLIIGSPIYYGEPTGLFRCVFERVCFPAMSYNDYSSTFLGKVDTDIILTMNVDETYYHSNYSEKFKKQFAVLRFLNGTIKIHPFFDTLQVSDYSKYEMAGFNAERKMQRHEQQFPIDLEYAFKICSAPSIV